MSEFVTPIQKYGRTWYKVVLGVSWRFLLWKQKHVTLINPRDLPHGDYPMVWAVPYGLGKEGHDPAKGEKLLGVDGVGGHHREGHGEACGVLGGPAALAAPRPGRRAGICARGRAGKVEPNG